MSNKQLSWGLYQSAKQWGKRPSEMVAIKDEYVAYCFDEAIGTWGSFIVAEMEAVQGKDAKTVERKRRSTLLKLIDAPDESRFRQVGRRQK